MLRIETQIRNFRLSPVARFRLELEDFLLSKNRVMGFMFFNSKLSFFMRYACTMSAKNMPKIKTFGGILYFIAAMVVEKDVSPGIPLHKV